MKRAPKPVRFRLEWDDEPKTLGEKVARYLFAKRLAEETGCELVKPSPPKKPAAKRKRKGKR